MTPNYFDGNGLTIEENHIIGITIRHVPLSSNMREKGSQLGTIGENRVLVRRPNGGRSVARGSTRTHKESERERERKRENWLQHFCHAVKGQYENFTRASSSHEPYASTASCNTPFFNRECSVLRRLERSRERSFAFDPFSPRS